MYKSLCIVLSSLLVGCTETVTVSKQLAELPVIVPDYKEVTIPAALLPMLAGLWGAFSHAFGRIRAILEPTVRTLMSAYAALASAVFSVVEIFGVAASATDGSSWRTFGTVIGTVAGVLLQGLAFALKIVAWNLSLIVRALAVVVRSVVWVGKVIVGSLVGAAKFIYKFLLPVRMIGEAFMAAGKIVYAVWQVLTGDISLLDGLKAIGGAVYDFLATPFRWARDVVVGVWNFISGIFTSIGRLVADAAGQIGQAILNLPIISTLRDMFATVRSFFAGDTTFFEAGKKLLITLGEGIWSAVTYPFTMLKNALGKLRNLLPFSDAREGPLASLTASGSALLKTLADGMSLTQSLPAKVFGFAARGILSAAAGAWQQIKTAGGNLMDAASAPFRMAGKLWDGLTSGAQTVAAKAGAIFGGLRYGEGTLYTRNAGNHHVFWQGPSLGLDLGGDGARTMILVYNMPSVSSLYTRFGGVAGSAYFVGGFGLTALTANEITLVPVRSGVGARLGINVGYLKFTPTATWNPF